MQELDVATGGGGVCLGVRAEAVGSNEGVVNVMKDIGPNLSDGVHLIEVLNGAVRQRVGGVAGAVRVRANAGGAVDHVGAEHVVGEGRANLPEPLWIG